MTSPSTALASSPGRPGRLWGWFIAPGVVAAAVVGLVLRVLWGAYAGAHPPQAIYDPARYLEYARVIADGQGMIEPLSGHPTAYYPPGYPWFLGIVTWLSSPFTDDVPRVAAMVQALLGTASVLLGAHIALELAGRRAALVAAWGLALYPNLILHSGVLLGETLYIFLILGFLWLVIVRLRGEHSTGAVTAPWPVVLGTGLVLGLAVMVRPIGAVMVPVLGVIWWWRSGDRARALRNIGLISLGVVMCIVPWTVRNTVRLGHTVVLSTNTGDNLCIGHAEGANGAFTFNDPCVTDHFILNGPDDEVASDREKIAVAFRAIVDDPGRQPWLAWRRFWVTWIRDGDHDGLVAAQSYMSDPFVPAEVHRRVAYGADVVYWMTGAVGVVGLVVLARRRDTGGLILLGAAAVNTVVPLVFFGASRFKVPVIPLLLIAAAVAVAAANRDQSRVEASAEG